MRCSAKHLVLLACWPLLSGCRSGNVAGPDASNSNQPETPASGLDDCRGPGRYEAGKEGSYRPCCAGLREVFYLTSASTADGTKSCVAVPLRVYACVQGRCGDGVCEVGEAEACGCVADCPSAVWGDVPTGEVGDASGGDASTDRVRPVASLATDVDPARMSADLLATAKQLAPTFGFTSPADLDSMQLGRPYGVFTIHKGPWLEFMGYWRVPVLIQGQYQLVLQFAKAADGYAFLALGSADFARLLAGREQVPALSAALDAGRAGLLWIAGAYGERYIGYEVFSGADPVATEIRAQSLSWSPTAVPGVDGAATPPELTLTEVVQQLPPE
jgi:hypothetical protein